MITGILTFLIIFAVIGSILYGQRLIKTEKSDAVFGNPERAKGGVHWVIVGSSFLLLSWLYYSWDIAKAFYPKSANELCQVAKVDEAIAPINAALPIGSRYLKSTTLVVRNSDAHLVRIHDVQPPASSAGRTSPFNAGIEDPRIRPVESRGRVPRRESSERCACP